MTQQINEYKTSGQHFIGDFARPTLVTINQFEGQVAQVLVENDTNGGRVEDSTGHVVKQLPPDRGKVVISTIFQSAQWRVVGIQGVT